MYVMLKEFDQRRGPELTADAIAAELRERCQREVRGAIVSAFGAPPIDGLGTTGGFKLIIEDRGNLGLDDLAAGQRPDRRAGQQDAGAPGPVQQLAGRTRPGSTSTSTGPSAWPWACRSASVFNTLQVYLGSYYVNNFNEFGRTWQVNVQADQRFRDQVHDIRQLQVRNNQGQMIRLGTLMDVRNTSGPVMVHALQHVLRRRHHRQPGAGHQLGAGDRADAGDRRRGAAAVDGLRLDRAGLSCSSRRATRRSCVFALAVVFVFLVLAAQYESWKLPLAVILVVPMCLLCSLVGVELAGMDVTIFTQIGFVVLVGLASKNAILIVEFAKQQPGGRRAAARGDPRGVPAAAAADPDDLVRLHPRRRARW